MIWKFIKPATFFPKYCPNIKDYKRKISGRNGRGNPLDFSEADKVEIRAGLRVLIKEILNY
jgi:hypothetical protein